MSTARSAFYCLEHSPSQMLCTGNSFAFLYNFENLSFHSYFSQNQRITHQSNPLIDQYLNAFSKTTADRSLEIIKVTKNT